MSTMLSLENAIRKLMAKGLHPLSKINTTEYYFGTPRPVQGDFVASHAVGLGTLDDLKTAVSECGYKVVHFHQDDFSVFVTFTSGGSK